MPRIPHEEFVRAWQHAETLEEVAQEFGITPKLAGIRAACMRKKGVPLKQMAAKPRVDWARLAALAEELSDDDSLAVAPIRRRGK